MMFSVLREFCNNFSSVQYRLLFAAVTSFLLVLLCGKPYIKKLVQYRIGQKIREFAGQSFHLAELHKQKKETPTMGGGLVIAATALSMVLWADWSSFFTPLLLLSLLVFGTVGAVDDWAKLKSKSFKGLSGKIRLLVQSLFAGFVIVLLLFPQILSFIGFSQPTLMDKGMPLPWETFQASMYIPYICAPLCVVTGIAWFAIVFVEWLTIVGAANAVNLTDGLDGLAAGCTVCTAGALCVLAFLSGEKDLSSHFSLVYVQSSGEIAVCLAALIGACFGFLWYNTYPGQIFMGDTGSLAIGGMLGTAAVLLRREWFLALVGAVFVAETFSVIIQVFVYKRTKKRVFRCAPLHHHFEYAGVHEAKVVMRFWIVAFIFASLGLLAIL
jgi:phospho-N-acetylmuramoyl-pentapeptide-transferase